MSLNDSLPTRGKHTVVQSVFITAWRDSAGTQHCSKLQAVRSNFELFMGQLLEAAIHQHELSEDELFELMTTERKIIIELLQALDTEMAIGSPLSQEASCED